MAAWLYDSSDNFEQQFAALAGSKREQSVDVAHDVSRIVESVRTGGDAALIEFTRKFDKFDAGQTGLKITPEEIEAGHSRCPRRIVEALKLAEKRITAYHRRQLPGDEFFCDDEGVELGHKWSPVDAVGLYVPGGLAAYPSSVLMNALPARVAGVKRLVMVVPTPGGVLNDLIMAAAKISGITEAYRVGGAQAIAALAFGTETIAPVAKIAGPGNAYVAAAKRQVYGVTGIDMIAGPSEVLIISDGSGDPSWTAADLLAQAEHDASAQSILITTDEAFAKRVEQAVEEQLENLPRTAIAGASWHGHGAIIIVAGLKQAVALSNRLAPEHLEIATQDPGSLLPLVRNAGSVFLGHYTPEAIGDYVAGPNHVLPTAGSARFSSGLNVLDFMKRTSILKCSPSSLSRIGPAAVTLGKAEGLDGHARSVAIRLDHLKRRNQSE